MKLKYIKEFLWNFVILPKFMTTQKNRDNSKTNIDSYFVRPVQQIKED